MTTRFKPPLPPGRPNPALSEDTHKPCSSEPEKLPLPGSYKADMTSAYKADVTSASSSVPRKDTPRPTHPALGKLALVGEGRSRFDKMPTSRKTDSPTEKDSAQITSNLTKNLFGKGEVNKSDYDPSSHLPSSLPGLSTPGDATKPLKDLGTSPDEPQTEQMMQDDGPQTPAEGYLEEAASLTHSREGDTIACVTPAEAEPVKQEVLTMAFLIGDITLAAITGTPIPAPYLSTKSR